MKGAVGRNGGIKGFSEKASDGNEKQFCGNWKKGNPSYKVAKNLA